MARQGRAIGSRPSRSWAAPSRLCRGDSPGNHRAVSESSMPTSAIGRQSGAGAPRGGQGPVHPGESCPRLGFRATSLSRSAEPLSKFYNCRGAPAARSGDQASFRPSIGLAKRENCATLSQISVGFVSNRPLFTRSQRTGGPFHDHRLTLSRLRMLIIFRHPEGRCTRYGEMSGCRVKPKKP